MPTWSSPSSQALGCGMEDSRENGKVRTWQRAQITASSARKTEGEQAHGRPGIKGEERSLVVVVGGEGTWKEPGLLR